MSWWSRWASDLRRPETPTRREELPFLVLSAATIVAAAQWSDPGGPAELLSLICAALAFPWRGLSERLPSELFGAVVLVGAGFAVGPDGELEIGLFLVVIAVLYTAWHSGSTTRATIVLIASTSMPWYIATVEHADVSWQPWASACVFTFVLGRNLRRQQMLIEQLESTQQALADAAVAEERRRIAMDLHDLAGHTLAAMLLHVTGARHVLRRDVADAERALFDAEAVGRASLDQIRSTVAALRTTEPGTERALAGSADVMDLVDEYRRAGLEICADVAEDVLSFDGPVGTAVHRIAREALANVARHAHTNTVKLTVELTTCNGEATAVRLIIADHGERRAADPQPGGFGLIGMRERARGLGGDLSAGPSTDGWRVEASLPVQSVDESAAR